MIYIAVLYKHFAANKDENSLKTQGKNRWYVFYHIDNVLMKFLIDCATSKSFV